MLPWRRGERQDLLIKLGAWEEGEGARRMGKGEEEGCRGNEGGESMSEGKNTREMSGDLQR